MLTRRSLLVLPALPLGGCGLAAGLLGEVPRPFQPESKTQNPVFFEPPAQLGILVREPEDIAPEKAREIAVAVARALEQLGYPASARVGNAGSYQLTGRVGGSGNNGERLLNVEFYNSRGQSLFRHQTGISPQELAAPPGGADWTAFAQDLAAAIDGNIQDIIQQYSASQRPPIFFGRITGLNEAGVRDVTEALRWQLLRNRQRVVDQPSGDTAVLDGQIAVSRTNPATVNFSIVWTLRRSDGREMGSARQVNDVAVAMLDRQWNQVVLALAEGAVDGIGQVLDRSPLTPLTNPITPLRRGS